MAGLTPKQEAFCLAYVETGNASEAYRHAYDAEKMSQDALWVEACKLAAHPKVALRLDELRAAHRERHQCTVDDIVRQLDEDRDFAREHETPAAAISATMGKAKLLGFLTDKSEVAMTLRRTADDLTDDELAKIAAGK